MKSAHLLPGGPTPPFARLLAALSAAGDDILPLTQRGPDWLVRWRTAPRLRAFAPRIVVAWSGRAAELAPQGNWLLLGRPEAGGDLAPYAACQHLIAATQAEARRYIGRAWPESRVHTVPYVMPDLAGETPAHIPAPLAAPKILAMARLDKPAGIDVLLAALTRVQEAHALIAGDGPERAALETLARQAGVAARAHFLGPRKDTAALLAACDVAVSPARHDTQGAAVLQAFAAGKPVVATMAEAALDLLRDGASGILVPANSGIALAAGIEGMLANPPMAAAMAASGRRHYEESYAAAPVTAAWRAVCAQILQCSA